MSIGVPIKVLHEAEGHIVTLETSTGGLTNYVFITYYVYIKYLIHINVCLTFTGEVYRGKLVEAEDNMNCHMSEITVTFRDGRVTQLENVYIRGSKIRFMILPDMLKNAPMFKNITQRGGRGGAGGPMGGRGRGGPPMRGTMHYCYISVL